MNINIELENVILGSILLEPDSLQTALAIITIPEQFENTCNQKIYKAIIDLNNQNKSIDILTVTQQLKQMNVLESIGGAYGGAYYVSSLTNRVASSANIESHCYIVLQYYLKRVLSDVLRFSQVKLNEPSADIFQLISEVETKVSDITNNLEKKDFEQVGIIKDREIETMRETLISGKRSGVPCGIERLNFQTNGWQKGDLIIIAGRPAMGKTACAVDFALTPALMGIPVCFFSLEMTREQLTDRMMSILSFINSQKIINKTVNTDELNAIEQDAKQLDNCPLFIDDTPAISLTELKNKARQQKKNNKIQLIVIDYLQLIRGTKEHREQEIAEISRGLKALAKELKVPIIVLSQLNRGAENRGDTRPKLSDLRESGQIEQDADLVIFPYRPEYYELKEYAIGDNVISTDGLLVFLVSKNRHGAIGEIKAKFIKEQTMITNYNIS